MTLYPLLLEPSLHTKVWGGRKLATVMGKALPTDDPYGESWELHDTSTVTNGPLAGRTLGDLLGEYGADLIGDANDPAEGFPLLAKILDANDWLSVQVHPNDAQAAELEGQPRGKTEAWLILATDPDAKLVIGVQPGTSRQAMAQAIRDNALEGHLVTQAIQAGDVLFIPAGTVHAIGPGTLLYEIQQSSNTTYRLYDWGRMGLDGNPRDLHIEKGVQVANVDALPTIDNHPPSDADTVMVASEYFLTTRYAISTSRDFDTNGRRFHSLTCIDGEVALAAGGETITLTIGRTALVPAAVGAYSLGGSGVVLVSQQPD